MTSSSMVLNNFGTYTFFVLAYKCIKAKQKYRGMSETKKFNYHRQILEYHGTTCFIYLLTTMIKINILYKIHCIIIIFARFYNSLIYVCGNISSLILPQG